MKITLNEIQIKKLIETLTFYEEGKNFKWDGCSCHGHYKQVERGQFASDCIEMVNALKPKCPMCKIALSDDGTCDNDYCGYIAMPAND